MPARCHQRFASWDCDIEDLTLADRGGFRLEYGSIRWLEAIEGVLGSAQKFGNVDFDYAVIEAFERNVHDTEYDNRAFDTTGMATL